MSTPESNPDRTDPSKQSGRPWMVTAVPFLFIAVLLVMLVIGVVVL